ncbi:MAG TPA: hypothetical protein VLJ37_08490 [bacterium]|nr:hypothetical protein [bacterium]
MIPRKGILRTFCTLALLSHLGLGCLAKGAQTAGGVSLTPFANPTPGGMAGPEASGVSSAMGGPDAGITDGAGESDPSGGEVRTEEGTVSDTPITVVGAPRGLSGKGSENCKETGFTLCFADVKVVDLGPEPETDRRQYRIEGCLLKKFGDSGPFVGVKNNPIEFQDLLFPELVLKSTSTGTTCDIQQPSVVAGRPNPAPRVRLKAAYCGRVTTLDLPLPEPASSPLTFDPCGAPGPTDVSSGGDGGGKTNDDVKGGIQTVPPSTTETPPSPPEDEPSGPADRLEVSPGYRRPLGEIVSP